MDVTLKQQSPTIHFPATRRKKIFFSTLLILLSLVVSIAVLEMALRLLYREEQAAGDYFGVGGFIQDDEVGYRHAPGFKGYIHRHDVFDCPVTISSNGLRQSNFDAQMQYSRRLLILGDSFAFGVGVPEDSIFATLIQHALNPAGIGVINGGQSGYGTTQEAKFGIRLAQIVKPEMIVLSLFSNNDVSGDYYKDYENVEMRYGQRLSKNRWLPIAPLDFIRARAYSWMLLEAALKRKTIEEQRAAFFSLAKDSTEQVMQPTLNAIKALRDFCQNNKVKLGIMMIQSVTGKTLFDEPLQKAFSEEGIPVLDLGERKFGRKNYFRGDAHWNASGHQRAAKQLAPFCMKLLDNT